MRETKVMELDTKQGLVYMHAAKQRKLPTSISQQVPRRQSSITSKKAERGILLVLFPLDILRPG